ncbi:MAG: HAD-superfamily hydrolase [Chlamydiia bacterium]|nr:HAD-superfamily hydrolase [Chlamydiia bacterium]
MHWIKKYQLFLFDLDGLLVNTEELHFRAYKEMCLQRGYHLPWDFAQYFSIAQLDAQAPERYIYAEFPELKKEEPLWSILYAEKKKAYLTLLAQEPAPLLPGVEVLLTALEKVNKKRCVVTHSALALVELIREQNPILQTIPHWFTREDYQNPKPSPDGYLKAIQALAVPSDQIIGFEDSLRGMRALMATKAYPVLVNSIDQKTKAIFEKEGVATFNSFIELLAVDHLD